MGTSWGQHITEARAKPPAFTPQGCVSKSGGEMGGKRLLGLTWGVSVNIPMPFPLNPHGEAAFQPRTWLPSPSSPSLMQGHPQTLQQPPPSSSG